MGDEVGHYVESVTEREMANNTVGIVGHRWVYSPMVKKGLATEARRIAFT